MLSFELPYDLRALAENNVGQLRAAYDQFIDALIEASGIWLSAMPQNETTTKLKAVQERAIRFSGQNIEAGLTYASELARAKDFADVLSVQSRFSERQMLTYAREVREIGVLMAGAAQNLRRTI
jgi:Phasin protein